MFMQADVSEFVYKHFPDSRSAGFFSEQQLLKADFCVPIVWQMLSVFRDAGTGKLINSAESSGNLIANLRTVLTEWNPEKGESTWNGLVGLVLSKVCLATVHLPSKHWAVHTQSHLVSCVNLWRVWGKTMESSLPRWEQRVSETIH